MKNRWQEIWSKRSRIDEALLEFLIKIDGFDSGPGSFQVSDWRAYVKELCAIMGLEKNDSVFEVGCGAGAFLYLLKINGHDIGGIDYSRELVDIGNRIIQNANFSVGDAKDLNVENKYDVVMSHAVFFYFPSLTYAGKILSLMVSKANKTVAILDVNDAEKKLDYETKRIKMFCETGGTREEYLFKYKDLEHLFFAKDFFYEFAKKLGLYVEIHDQNFEQYGNSPLRYNVIIRK